MFLSKISIDSRMIIHYIVEENVLIVIVYILSLQRKFYIVILKIVLKLIINKELLYLKKVNMLNSKILK